MLFGHFYGRFYTLALISSSGQVRLRSGREGERRGKIKHTMAKESIAVHEFTDLQYTLLWVHCN